MISIIIPVYNEETTIRKVLKALPYAEDLEVIVVDGGSLDRTVEFAKQYPVKMIECVKNRAIQMNAGARQAKGDFFLFLHADCILGQGSLRTIEDSLSDGYIGGCLSQKIDSCRLIYRWIEVSGNIRAKTSKVFYGDQAIFVRRDVFFKAGGFDNVSLFEDILFSKKIRNEGRTRVLNNKVFVSPRRWEKKGVIKTTLIYWLLSLGFFIRVAPNILKKIYDDIR